MNFLFQSTRSTDTLTKGSDYKKMVNNGSIDSMEKSTFNSSIEDNQSYDVFEAHNLNPSGYSTYSASTVNNPVHEYTNPLPKPTQNYPAKPQNQYSTPGSFGLAYKNEGFRDNSTFTSKNNSAFQSRAESVQDGAAANEETPIIHSSLDAQDDTYTTSDYYNTDTLPLHSAMGKSDSTLDLKRDLDDDGAKYDVPYGYEPQKMNFLQELKSKMPHNEDSILDQTSYMDLPTPPDPPRGEQRNYRQNGGQTSYQNGAQTSYPNYNPTFNPDYNTVGLSNGSPYLDRPQSSVLETNLDSMTPVKSMPKSRSKSEALLETNFDCDEPEEQGFGLPLTESSRSKSQPLETAM